MGGQVFKVGDPVRYIGGNGWFPMDSFLARHYLDKSELYIVERVGHDLPPFTEIKLIGIRIPFVSCLFEKARPRLSIVK